MYLVTTVPLFSLPQLSSSTEVKHFLTLILPYVLPVAHIGMVITIIIITIIVDLILPYILPVAHVEVVIIITIIVDLILPYILPV